MAGTLFGWPGGIAAIRTVQKVDKATLKEEPRLRLPVEAKRLRSSIRTLAEVVEKWLHLRLSERPDRECLADGATNGKID